MARLQRPLPEALLDHLLERVEDRGISMTSLAELRDWVDSNPEIPAGRWFKRFSTFTLCGEGPLTKTFLLPSQAPYGQEVF